MCQYAYSSDTVQELQQSSIRRGAKSSDLIKPATRPLSSVAALGGTLRSALSAFSSADVSPRVLGRKLGQALRSRLGASPSTNNAANGMISIAGAITSD